jgi:hypothetical protein
VIVDPEPYTEMPSFQNLSIVYAESAGHGRYPERTLGANLTQFDPGSRISCSSLGSWELTKFLAYRRKQRPAICGAKCPDHGAGV